MMPTFLHEICIGLISWLAWLIRHSAGWLAGFVAWVRGLVPLLGLVAGWLAGWPDWLAG